MAEIFRDSRGLIIEPGATANPRPREPQYPRPDASGPFIVWTEYCGGMGGDTWECESYDTLGEAVAAKASANGTSCVVTKLIERDA